MQAIIFAIEYLWIHFAVYARAWTTSIRATHDELERISAAAA